MKKLIELDAALDALREVIVPQKDIGFGDELTDGYNDGIKMAVTVVSELPTVDAVSVRHGRWEWDGEAFVCSACGSGYEGQPTMMGEPMFEFCPVCGADMRKGGEHDG